MSEGPGLILSQALPDDGTPLPFRMSDPKILSILLGWASLLFGALFVFVTEINVPVLTGIMVKLFNGAWAYITSTMNKVYLSRIYINVAPKTVVRQDTSFDLTVKEF